MINNLLVASIFILSVVEVSAKELTIDQAVSRFKSVDFVIAAAKSKLVVSTERLKEARTKFFPDISLVSTYLKQQVPTSLSGGISISPSELFTSSIVISQPIYLGGKIWAAYNTRELQHELEKHNFVERSQERILAFHSLVYNYLMLKKQLIILKESYGFQKRFVDTTLIRSRRGTARSFELDQARAGLFAYRPRLDLLRERIETMEDKIKSDLHLSASDKVELQDVQINFPSANIKLENMELFLKSRFEWNQAKIQVELAEQNKKLKLGDHLPSLALEASYGYKGLESSDLADSSSWAQSLGVSLTVPLFSGLSSLNVRRAGEEEVVAAKRLNQSVTKELRVQIVAAARRLKMAQSAYEGTKLWADRSERALSHGLESYRRGRIDNFQVIQLQNGRELAALSLSESLMEYRKAIVSWRAARGESL